MQALVLDNSKYYTYVDYLTWIDGKTRELIDGFIRMMAPSPRINHQYIVSSIAAELIFFAKKNKGKFRVLPKIDVLLPQNGESEDKVNTVVIPDISIVCDMSKLTDKNCIGAPDMIVEIRSPSTARYDLTTKFDLYERVGVREYWVVCPYAKTVDVFILQENGKYDEGTLYEEGKIPVHIFGGYELDFEDIFD
jgi:Uma2 family endonuclease